MAYNLPFEKKVNVIAMLAEGSSIRSIERVTGVNRNTIMNLAVRVGNGCAKIMDAKMRNLNSSEIQCDEVWGFIGAKQKNVPTAKTKVYGDVWTFIAIDPVSKVIPSYVVGKRDSYHTNSFMSDLQSRLSRRIQLSSDAMGSYAEAVEKAFGAEVDYAQLVKEYSVEHLGNFKEAARRYSPAEVVKVEKRYITGNPDEEKVCTSHIERQNLTLRMHCRRLTRLTNAFSKKFENFSAAVSLNLAYYNFCKVHGSIKCTPAMEAGVEKSIWTVAELVKACGE